jgi:hypothetical protein
MTPLLAQDRRRKSGLCKSLTAGHIPIFHGSMMEESVMMG